MNSINFFRDPNQNFLDKFVTWSLSYGRTIVMLTELIALLAFLYRFGIDQQLSDMHDKISQWQTIITLSKSNEDKFRNLQSRLQLATTVNQQGEQSIQHILDILDKAKGNVTFSSLSQTANILQLDVNTFSSADLSAFVNDLRDSPYVQSVNLDSLHTSVSTNQIEAKITATLYQTNNNL